METDVIIIGAGIAGLTTAIYLDKYGFDVIVVSKDEDHTSSNTYYAQGGIVYKGENDSAELLYNDIIKAGAGIANPEIVKYVSENAERCVKEFLIDELKINFSTTENGELDLTEEGAHSRKRILHYYDTTGKAIIEYAMEYIKNKTKVKLLYNYTAVDIITLDHHSTYPYRKYKKITALGIYALNNNTGVVEKILSKAVIIATGGMGQIYLHTTNPLSSTGDGYAMAYRCSARLINMEYTQFHPTTMYHPKAKNFLISEAVRGEGAVIVDKKGRPFMHKYHELKDLAPRDIVTRAILTEMLELGDKYVYLDATRIGEKNIKERFPNIYNKCLSFGIDITKEPIPIVPAFHFSCGGILTDINGKTNIKRLFAVGEVACNGLHGANRLASTSLLEGVVFGRKIAEFINENRTYYDQKEPYEILDWINTGVDYADPALINQDWSHLKNIMWNYVGPIRTEKRILRAINDINNLLEDIEVFYRDSFLTKKLIELRNAVQTARLVAKQALANRESRGAHYIILNKSN